MEDTYRIVLETITPEVVDVDEPYTIGYRVTNRGTSKFPGGSIYLLMTWSSMVPDAERGYSLELHSLEPDESQEFLYDVADRTAGVTIITMEDYRLGEVGHPQSLQVFRASNDNLILRGQTVGSIRVRSMEEILTNRLIASLDRSTNSQDRLANTQLWLTVVGTFIALFQLVGMFVIPYLQKIGVI